MPRCPQCGNSNDQKATFCNYCGTHLKGAEDPLIDRIVGKFRLKERIGGGGFGSVYRAEHIELGNLAAIKILHPHLSHNSLMVERFYREAKLLAKLDHPNIVKIMDYGKLEGLGLYLIMEWLDGKTIQWHLKHEGPPPLELVKKIFEQLLDALAYAHSKGVVHRDLKPENLIWICKGKRTRLLKVLDFGIARILQDSPGPHLTETGLAVGTPRYMSPEQAAGELDRVDHRSDIYACGVLLLELLTGKPIFTGTTNEILLKQIDAPPPRLSELAPDKRFPPGLELVLQRALNKNPEHRYSSAEEFADDLIGILECEETQIISPSSVYNPPDSAVRAFPSHPEVSLSPRPVLTGQRDPLPGPNFGEATPSPSYSPRAPVDYLPSSEHVPPPRMNPSFGGEVPQSETKALSPSLGGQLVLNGNVPPPGSPLKPTPAPPPSISPGLPEESRAGGTPPPPAKKGKAVSSSSLLGVFVGLGGAISLVVLIFFLFFFTKQGKSKDAFLDDLDPIDISSPSLPPIGTDLSKDKTISINVDDPIVPKKKGKSAALGKSGSSRQLSGEVGSGGRAGAGETSEKKAKGSGADETGGGNSVKGGKGAVSSKLSVKNGGRELKSRGHVRTKRVSKKKVRKSHRRRYKRRRVRKRARESAYSSVSKPPSPAPVKKVSIMIDTKPSGATVWIDDIKMGKSPLVLVFPINKKIKIWVKKPGYMGKMLIWEVRRGSPKPIVLPEDIVSGE